MLDVDTGGHKLRARLCHGSQEPLTPRIDIRDLIEVDNACSSTLVAVRFFPTCSQLGNPRPDQPALQNPSFFRWRLVDGDLQHVYLSCPPSVFGRVPIATGPCLAVSIELLELFLVQARRLPHVDSRYRHMQRRPRPSHLAWQMPHTQEKGITRAKAPRVRRSRNLVTGMGMATRESDLWITLVAWHCRVCGNVPVLRHARKMWGKRKRFGIGRNEGAVRCAYAESRTIPSL